MKSALGSMIIMHYYQEYEKYIGTMHYFYEHEKYIGIYDYYTLLLCVGIVHCGHEKIIMLTIMYMNSTMGSTIIVYAHEYTQHAVWLGFGSESIVNLQ